MYRFTTTTPRLKPPPSTYTLSDDEIVRWLRKFQYDPEFRDINGRTAVPIKRFCDFAGVSRASVYRFIWGDRPISDAFRERLTVAILAVRQGLRWRRLTDHRYVINDPAQWKDFPKYERVRKEKQGLAG